MKVHKARILVAVQHCIKCEPFLPLNGRALACLAAQESKQVLQELRGLEGAVGELTVIGQGDTKAGAEKADGLGNEQPSPREEEGSNKDEDEVVQDDAKISPEVHVSNASADFFRVQSLGTKRQQRALQFHHEEWCQGEPVCSRVLLVRCHI
jgi:hypothetical protein